MTGADRELAIGHESRAKKRKTVDVVPMGVGEHQYTLFHAVFQELKSKISNACSSVHDDAVITCKHFKATGIAAINHMLRRWAGDTATNAPERKDLQTLFAEVARRSGCEVWDYTAARPPEGLFKDAGHLNREGRAHYSRALGNRLAEALKDR